ncbi:trehalose-phosphatase [Xanthomonas massiliensis]|uniref:trehalose-phosphatase n=1 Tax=Xanthomonas massiliensis TaxID=1720302 RepID=UPI0008258116|nr:trehalose-phosphatase [Xanthomonas massiliensis]
MAPDPCPGHPPLLDADCALFLDVDGTLLDFADRPDRVRPAAGLGDILARLHRRLHGALALVSGRPLAELDRLFAPLVLPAAGLHGHQLRPTPEIEATPPDEVPDALHALHAQAERFAAQHPGVLVEDKGAGLALHWRRCPESGADVQAFARQYLGQLEGYRLQPGDHVVEFVPSGCDKGAALRAMMDRPPFAGRVPVFVGDDLTDEFGFAAANALGGWSVRVGRRLPTAATYGLDEVAAVHAWLQEQADG